MKSLRHTLLACAALADSLAAQPAAAQLILTGAGGHGGSAGAPPVNNYAPLGVAYWGNVAIRGPMSGCAIAAYSCSFNAPGSPSKTALISWWQWEVRAPPASGGSNTLTQSSPFDPIRQNGNVSCETGKAPCLASDNTSNKMQLNFYSSTGGTTSQGIDVAGVSGHTVQTDGQWQHFLLGYDLNAGTMAIYRDDANVGPTGSGDFAYTTHNVAIDWSNANRLATLADPMGMGLVNANQTDNSWGYQSDTFVDISGSPVCTGVGAPGTMFGVSVTCTAANTIPAEVRRKFIDGSGKPVQRVNADCSDVTGAQPILCVYGDGAAFAVNHGSADSSTGSAATAFAVDPLITGATVFKPPYGPAGVPAGVATLVQLQANNTGTVCAAVPCTFSIRADAIAGKLATNDFAIVAATLHDNTSFFTAGQTFACSSPGSTSWTLVQTFQSGAGHKEAQLVCYGFLASDDLGGVYSITWQTGVTATRDRSISFAAYRNVASVDVAGVGSVLNTTSTSNCTPSITTTTLGDTLVSIFSNFAGSSGRILTPTAPLTTDQLRLRVLPTSGTPGQHAMLDENATTNGGTPVSVGSHQHCVTLSSADSYEAFIIALKHN